MKCFFILLTLACICHISSTQSDGDPYFGLGYLRPIVERKIRNCGQIWITQCHAGLPSIPTGWCRCAPTFELSSEAIQTARLGGSILLLCAFSGYPLPTILWRGPQDSLPDGRHMQVNWDTTLILNGITESDEGNYSCTASNIFGQNAHSLQIRVVVAPVFKNMTDVPYNLTVTEGETVTFNCNPYAIPEANIIWLLNEQPIDTDSSSTRFEFSDDMKSLTIRDVCRDCVDGERQTDLMVIQCNASNIYGYAFASGYLNVLMKTKVTIGGSRNVSVDFLAEKQFVFECNVTSDPSTPATVRWYKTEPSENLVRTEPPYVNVTNEFLIIAIDPNCSAECVKYLGEYRCVGDNGYSRDNQTIMLTLPYTKKPPPKTDSPKGESLAVWKTVLAVLAIALGLLLVGIFLRFRSKQSSDDAKRRMTEVEMPNPPNTYNDIGHDSVVLPLEELSADKEESMPGEGHMYDRIDDASTDHALEEIAQQEASMPYIF